MISPELVEKAIEKIKQRGANYQYFFDHLKSPDWIQPLKEKGFFSHPPQPIEENGYISFPLWPESRYLARVAAEAPELVLQIALEIPETENARVHEDLIEAALSMPPYLAEKLGQRVMNWIQSPYLLLPMKVASLVSHLAQGDQIEVALGLTKELLKVMPGRHPEGMADTSSGISPRSRIDLWEYEQFLKNNLPDLVRKAPQQTLALLCDILEESLEIGKVEYEQEFLDYSHIWRPAIEPHPQNWGHDVRDYLVSAIRDTSIAILERTPKRLIDVVYELEARRWPVFRRVALYLIDQLGRKNFEEVVKKLTDRTLFDDVSLYHEYSRLLQDYFSQLNRKDQEIILNWIEQGPDFSYYIRRSERDEGKRPIEDELLRRKELWQLRRLAVMKDSLPDPWRRKYEVLVLMYSEPEYPDLLSWSTGVLSGPTSPKSLDQIEQMTVSKLVDFLMSWVPPSGFTMESAEGISRMLTKAVAKNPSKYLTGLNTFKGLDPTYIRGLIAGFREALKEGEFIEWQSILVFSRWIVDQPREIPGRSSEDIGDWDLDWGWTRKEIAWLIEEGLEKEDNKTIPFDGREDIWYVLKGLTQDPDPTPEYEQRYGGSNMDPATLSINTTRGVTFHTLIAFATWLKKHLLDQMKESENQLIGFDAMPEIRAVLETHLDIEQDPSLAVRAVYGWKFGSLLYLDRNWTKANTENIFPQNQAFEIYRRAAWDGYILFSRPNAKYLDILKNEYLIALERLDPSKESESLPGKPPERLAEHLMVYYWWGEIALDSQLLRTFWTTAGKNLRGHAIEFIGRTLFNTTDTVPNEIKYRLIDLWKDRVHEAKESKSVESFSEELKSFGWWFVSGVFSTEWSLQQLEEVLSLFGEVEPGHLVLERLATITDDYPTRAVSVLGSMIEGDRKGWAIHAWQDEAKKILKSALNSNDQLARQESKGLINRLGARGLFEYRDLLG
jgi:hypothetical protein